MSDALLMAASKIREGDTVVLNPETQDAFLSIGSYPEWWQSATALQDANEGDVLRVRIHARMS